jgi:hypothetical protein
LDRRRYVNKEPLSRNIQRTYLSIKLFVRFRCKFVKIILVIFSHVDICFKKRGSRNERCCTEKKERSACITV